MPRSKYHFEAEKGWINDPNGLIYFKGKHHLFFQYNPYDVKWGTMHWGHAVSDDLINWTHLPIALYPDKPYDTAYGCWSGSAVVKDDRLYLIYTACGEDFRQTQCIAYSDDGITFTKYEKNPVIDHFPEDGSADFRDPKVFKIGDTYHMVLASGKDGIGKILRYTSKDLFNWDYAGVLFEDRKFTEIAECPDFFELDGKYVLMYSLIIEGQDEDRTAVAIGSFDGEKFVPERVYRPEHGPHFYATQSFIDKDGERIVFAWTKRTTDKPVEDEYMGALSAPRELHVKDGKLISYPIKALQPYLTDSDSHVRVCSDGVEILDNSGNVVMKSDLSDINDVKILRDTHCIEVFINGGEESFLYWFDN